MARRYFQEDVTVCTIGQDSCLTEIGSGKVSGTETTAENIALMDTWDSEKIIRQGVEVTLDLASDDEATLDVWALWLAKAAVALVLTGVSGKNFSGNFLLKSPGTDLADALKDSITLKSQGAVTIN